MALFAISYLRSALARFHQDTRAQDAFEYLLVIGGVAVLIVGLVVTGMTDDLVDAVINGVCTAIDGVMDLGTTCATT